MPQRGRKCASDCSAEEAAFLQSIVHNPGDDALWLILGDWLEEHDDPRRAELLRLHRKLLATCCEPQMHPERTGQQARIVQLLTEGVRPCVPRQTLKLERRVEMAFAWIPPGSFLMGSPESEPGSSDEETQHAVTLIQGFWLALTPVTQAQWNAVMGSNPSCFKGKDRPVERVSWDDCQEFCRQLGERACKSLRLPTEAEWEYACRAGTTTPFFFGDSITSAQANHDSSVGKTTAVGSYPCNAWGLYDLHGNVWEWTSSEEGPSRVIRGGSWSRYADYGAASDHRGDEPGNRSSFLGFRLLAAPSERR